MSNESSASTTRESRLDQVIATYLQALEDGHAPDRHELLARHLDLAAELSEFFADQDQFDRLAAPLRAMKPEPPAGKGAPPPADPVPGTRVGYFGDYELLGEIARGGMGVVYRARQRGLNRVVALKMIRMLPAASPDDVRRFQAEAEAAANLDHPNIVPIYEMGEFQGQHYFTMKLVDGGSLAAHLPSLTEDPGAAARLLEAVARAVHYAHERGILHRDLKPANILLQRKSHLNPKSEDSGNVADAAFHFRASDFEPVVTDFGLAKRFGGDSGLTQSGMIVGTPSYMAPEQASGRKTELTTAADVYSLGAILYELLTGWPPFRGETPLGTLRQVTEQEPRPLRAQNRRISWDLETICLKCLAKDARRRYTTALELAEELRRFLDGRPIQARRRAWWARVLPFRGPKRRGRKLAVACLLLVVFLMLTSFVAMRRQLVAVRMAEVERYRAQANYENARQAVDALLLKSTDEAMGALPQLQPAQRQLLQEALQFYEQLARDRSTNPKMQEETAAAYRRLGAIYQVFDQPEKAEESFRQAIALYEQLITRSPMKIDYQAALAEVDRSLGSLLQKAGRLREAGQVYREGVTLAEKIVELQPQDRGSRYRLALGLRDLSDLQAQLKQGGEAENALRRARAILEKMVAEAPGINEAWPDGDNLSKYQAALASTLTRLARLAAKHPADAERLYESALAIQQKLVAEEPANAEYRRDLADTHDALGVLLQAGTRKSEAEQHYRKAIAILEKLNVEQPHVRDYRQRLASTYGHVAEWLRSAGRAAEAEEYSRKALSVR
jgi:serine/threonine-protein kinase